MQSLSESTPSSKAVTPVVARRAFANVCLKAEIADVARLAVEEGATPVRNVYAIAHPGGAFSDEAWFWPEAPRVLVMTGKNFDCAIAIFDGDSRETMRQLWDALPYDSFGQPLVISPDGRPTYTFKYGADLSRVVIRHSDGRFGPEIFVSVHNTDESAD
jgi:hypothetical protein